MDKERVNYFSKNDMAYGLSFNKIETIKIPQIENIDINDAIEFYEIKRYFDDGARNKDWSDEQYEEYKEKGKKLFGLTMRFFNALDDNNVVDRFQEIDEYHYEEEFWSVFNKCKLYKKISEEIFEKLLSCEHASLYDICSYEQIVEHYGNAIRSSILSHFGYVDLVLHVYEQNQATIKKLHIPNELTGEDICNYLINYVESDSPNYNILNEIVLMQPTNRIPVSDELRLKAKRKSIEIGKKLFDKDNGFMYSLEVAFSDNQKEEKLSNITGRKASFSYSKGWLLESLDYPSILNNFIYIFEYSDIIQMRCSLVSKSSQTSLFEAIMQSESKRRYPANFVYNQKNTLALMQMTYYYDFLLQNNIRYESVLEWFFTKYMQEEFGVSEMRVKFPSKGASFYEKCLSICSAFEIILKQYSLYVKYKQIDFELLSIMENSKKIKDIPSLVENKYLYGEGQEFNAYKYLLFSDQCMLSFVKRLHDQGKQYSTFFELISNEEVTLSDYREGDYVSIEQLKKEGFIRINENGSIKPDDKKKIMIIKDLNDNDVISRWHYSPDFNDIIKEWVDRGILVAKSSLLSEPEINYFNYILNHADFDNGLDLRNGYMHGTQQIVEDDKVHEQNYYRILIILTILAIKINDDLDLYNKHTVRE